MIAIACCSTVSCVYHAAVPLWVSCCRTGIWLDNVCRGSHVSYAQNSYNARGLEPCLVQARCSTMVSTVTFTSILFCESLVARKTKRWTALGVRCGYLEICCLCARWYLKTVLRLVLNRMQVRLLLVPCPSVARAARLYARRVS